MQAIDMALQSASKRKARGLVLPMLLAVSAMAVSGCAGDEPTESQDASSSALSFYVKDAPTDQWSQLLVTVAGVEVLSAGASTWMSLAMENATVDLLALRAQDARQLLASAEVPVGRYDALRLAVTHVTAIDHAGAERGLIVAGDVLTVQEPFEVGIDRPLDLLLDIDANASVDAAGLTFAAAAIDMRSSALDSDGDGLNDFDDLEMPRRAPRQVLAGVFGLCTAWSMGLQGREAASSVAGSAPFVDLTVQAQAAGQSVDSFCAAESALRPAIPIPPKALARLEQTVQHIAMDGDLRVSIPAPAGSAVSGRGSSGSPSESPSEKPLLSVEASIEYEGAIGGGMASEATLVAGP